MLYLMLVPLSFPGPCFIFKLQPVCDVCDLVNQFCFEKLTQPNVISEDSSRFECLTCCFAEENSPVLLLVTVKHIAQRAVSTD